MKWPPDIKKIRFYFWTGLAYYGLWLFSILASYRDTFWLRAVNDLWRVVYIIPVNLLFFEYALPYILARKKYLVYNILWGLMLFWVFLILWSFGLFAWRAFGIALGIYSEFTRYETIDEGVEHHFGYSVASVIFFGLVRHVFQYIHLRQSAQKLLIEKQQAELNYLKSQTNPHFLFNTLNNIYSLARDKSDLAPESIMRLSKILRYMLYETGGEYIAIEQELKIIGDYIELEKLRYDESLRVNFNYDIEDMKQALPPLLLIPLVENAFKHGVSETRSRPFVDIHLAVKQRRLNFEVKNSVDPFSGEKCLKENIGLANLRRQLELLYTDYRLSVDQGDSAFTAILYINLASHV